MIQIFYNNGWYYKYLPGAYTRMSTELIGGKK